MTGLLAGRYELGAELGAGGMARVCEAYDRTLARRVAVKLLHAQALSQPGMRERFLQEARTAASFSHPHAVATYDTGRDDGVPYIVMELVEGRSLAEVLDDRGALRPDEAVAVSSQILSALGAAHRSGLVHRDVKPANVLLPGGEVPSHPTGDPPAKLADFGIAKGLEAAAAALTATGQVLGTPRYVSPEQVSGASATPRSDVYSVGVMLYEMLAGAPPFEADSPLALALAHREDPVPRLDRRVRGLDRGLAAVVHRALEKDPAQRFADASEMRAALADPTTARVGAGAAASTMPLAGAVAAPTEVLATEEPGGGRGTSWRPVALVAAAAMVLLLIVAIDWPGLVDRFLPTDEAPADVDDAEPPEDDAEDPPADEDEEEPPPDEGEEEPPPDENGDPPGQNGDDNEGNDDPPGQNGDPPGQNGDPPGQENGEDNGDQDNEANGNPPGQNGDPPGQSGDPPGQQDGDTSGQQDGDTSGQQDDEAPGQQDTDPRRQPETEPPDEDETEDPARTFLA